MNNKYDFIGSCPPVVHNRINNTLNNLPNRKRISYSSNFFKCAAASVATLLLMFIITWAVNPVLAQGLSFRDTIINVFSNNPEINEIIEAPLPTPTYDESLNEISPQATPLGTEAPELPDDYDSEIQPVIVDGFEFRIEDYVAYDGSELIVGYNVRKADGSPMPTLDEYTKVHPVGFIRGSHLVVGDEMARNTTANMQDYGDPNVYRQLFAFDLRDVNVEITEETIFKLNVVIYHYGDKPSDLVETVVELPFSVNTSHENIATQIEVEKNTFARGDFIVKVQPIVSAVTSTQIIIHAYKEDEPNWGKQMDGYLFMNVKGVNDEFFPCSPYTGMASLGFGRNDDGSTYLESIYYIAPAFDLPEQFKIIFNSGDMNPGENVDYEPIIVTIE